MHGNGRNGHDRVFHPSSRRDIRLELPPEPEPARFTDWSSIALPPATFPHGTPGISTDPTDHVQNQVNVPAAIGARQERGEINIAEGVAIAPQQDVLREDSNTHTRPAAINIDTRAQINVLEPEEEMIDIIPPIAVGTASSSPHINDVVTSAPQGSSTNDDSPRCFQLGSHTIEGMSSIQPVDSHITSGIRQMVIEDRGRGLPRTSTMNRRDSSDSSDDERLRRERDRPPERDRYSSRDRRPSQ